MLGMQLTALVATMAIVALGHASTIPVMRRQRGGTDIFANVGDACSVGRQDGECDQFGRCVQFIPPNEQSILNQGRKVAACTRTPNGQTQDTGFGSSFNGEGSPLFGNVGLACTVGNDEGACDRFGRCVQFIPPNENNVLNRGRELDTCTAGGQTGTLRL